MNKVAAEQGFEQVRLVVKKLWRMLPTIHSEFGFFGGFLCRDIYFDKATQKVTLCRWDRQNLPFSGTKSCWLKLSGPYKRLVNGYGSEKVPFAIDKQALLTCLVVCRLKVNALNGHDGYDDYCEALDKYMKTTHFFDGNLEELDSLVTELLETLLGPEEDAQIVQRVLRLNDAHKEVLGKRDRKDESNESLTTIKR